MRKKQRAKEKVSAERLREVLHYTPATGLFVWLVAPSKQVKAGDVAGCKGASGYISIGLDRGFYSAHRLAWLYVTGLWPSKVIDHKNGNKADNRFENLRDVSLAVNLQNLQRCAAGNPSGYLGVSWEKKRACWIANIHVNGKQRRLGKFSDPKDAHEAYLNAKRLLHEGNML